VERKRSGAGQNSGGAEQSGERVSEKLGGAERERGAAERERSGEWKSDKSGLIQSGKTVRSAPLTCSANE